jgi:hypothetical protein
VYHPFTVTFANISCLILLVGLDKIITPYLTEHIPNTKGRLSFVWYSLPLFVFAFQSLLFVGVTLEVTFPSLFAFVGAQCIDKMPLASGSRLADVISTTLLALVNGILAGDIKPSEQIMYYVRENGIKQQNDAIWIAEKISKATEWYVEKLVDGISDCWEGFE